MAKKLTKANLAVLATVVAATQGNTVAYTSPKDHAELVAQGFVEINAGMVDNDGNIATRATAKGIEMNGNTEQSNTGAGSQTPAAPKPTFTLEAAALPTVSGRGGGRDAIYPFDEMQVGQSFFVPASAERPDPAKSLASTVSSATRRYSEETGETRTDRNGNVVPKLRATRKFAIRARSAADEAKEGFNHGQNGARIYRIA